jgi:hypothetical protein
MYAIDGYIIIIKYVQEFEISYCSFKSASLSHAGWWLKDLSLKDGLS